MGRRGEVFTRKIFVKDGEKTYFFNIKENRYGDVFLNLVESSSRKGGDGFQRNSIMIYKEDFTLFMDGFNLCREHIINEERTSLSIERGNESARRKFHFSVKKNKYGVASIYISEERVGHVNERRNESILVDERDMEEFMLGFKPIIDKMNEDVTLRLKANVVSRIKANVISRKKEESAPRKKMVVISHKKKEKID